MKKDTLYLPFLIFLLFTSQFHLLFAQEKKLDDLLDLSLEELTTIQIITASKIPQKIQDVPAAVRVITAEQIRNNGYVTLEEALSDLPGMQFRNINGYNSYVFMRGVPSQNNLILVLVDGVQINELNSGGFYGGGQYNLSDADHIEIVYGPASALYGTNAISGIINIITKNPDEHAGLDLSALYGTFNTMNADLSYGYWNDDKKLGFRISGMVKATEKADLAETEGDNNWTNEMENFENDLSLSAKLNLKSFTAGVFYQEKKASMTTTYQSVGREYLDKNTLWDIAFINGYLKYTNDKNEKWTFNTMLYYRNATVKPNSVGDVIKATDTTSGNQIAYYRPNQLVGIENQLNYKATERLMIIGGLIGEIEQLSDGFSTSSSNSQDIVPPEPKKPNQLNNKLFSYFIQVHYKLVDQLSFIGGLRHDFSSYYGQVFTPRTGLVFNENKFTVKLLYDEAFRAPKPWDYKYGIGNNDLKPEKMRSLELALSYLVMDNLSIGSSVYRNLIKDKLIKESTMAGSRWFNKNKLNTLGFELGLEYRKQAVQSYVNYTWNHSTDENDVMIPEISEHQVNMGMQYAFSNRLRCSIRGNYIGKRKNPKVISTTGSEFVDAAFVVHSTFTYSIYEHLDIQIIAKNLLDAEYYHTSNLPPDRYRQPQRTLLIQASYQLK
jgi:outer membrane receptor for ferrienterochelin and colicins